MNYIQFWTIDDARAETDRTQAQLEATQATLDALAENASSAYSVLAALIRDRLPADAALYHNATDAQMVDSLVSEYGEDDLIEMLKGV